MRSSRFDPGSWGDRLTAGRRVLAPLIQVRILVSQPSKIKGLRFLIRKFFLYFNLFSHLYKFDIIPKTQTDFERLSTIVFNNGDWYIAEYDGDDIFEEDLSFSMVIDSMLYWGIFLLAN